MQSGTGFVFAHTSIPRADLSAWPRVATSGLKKMDSNPLRRHEENVKSPMRSWQTPGTLMSSGSLMVPHSCFRWITSACISSCIPVMLFFFPTRPKFAIAWCSYKISPTNSVPSVHNVGNGFSQIQMKSDLLTRLDPRILQLSEGSHSQHLMELLVFPPVVFFHCLSFYLSFVLSSHHLSYNFKFFSFNIQTNHLSLGPFFWSTVLKSSTGNHKTSLEIIHSYSFLKKILII